jgi:hypothetical protein
MVIVYDGLGDLVRVYEVWSKLVVRFVHDIQIHCSAWNFSLLRDAELQELAARRTAEADMVVLSANGKNNLPDHMKDWIASWLPHKAGRGGALVAVLEPRAGGGAPEPVLRNYLREIARDGGMDFFCNEDQPLLPPEEDEEDPV